VKDEVWDEIKLVDPSFHDLAADLTVDPSASAHPAETSRTYTVQKGDSLWRIAERFLGDGRELDRIVRANPDKLEGADSVIHPGDVLRIPS
jgi:nucleoid-associated protein YgaU